MPALETKTNRVRNSGHYRCVWLSIELPSFSDAKVKPIAGLAAIRKAIKTNMDSKAPPTRHWDTGMRFH